MAAPQNLTAAEEYNRIRLTCDSYNADLTDGGNVYNIFVHWQFSTTGDFTGEEITLGRSETRQQVLEVEQDWDNETTPLVWSELFFHLNPPNAQNFYRARFERWVAGSMVESTTWSTSANVTASSVSITATSNSWTVPGLRSRLFLLSLIYQSNTNSADSVEQAGVSDSNLSGGIAGVVSTFESIEGRAQDIGLVVRGPWGGYLAFTGDDDDTKSVRYSIGVDVDDNTLQTDTSFFTTYDMKQAGDDLGGGVGAQMEAMVDDYAENILPLASRGVHVVTYEGPPFRAFHQHSVSHLRDNGRLGITMAANSASGWDVVGPSAATNVYLGENSGPRKALDWLVSNEAAGFVWLESVLGSQAQVNEWLSLYSGQQIGIVHLFRTLFDDDVYNSSQTLQLETGRVDPRAHPDYWVMVWIDSSSCDYVSNGNPNSAKMSRMVEVALDLLAYSPNICVAIGGASLVNSELTPSQGALLRSAASIAQYGTVQSSRWRGIRR